MTRRTAFAALVITAAVALAWILRFGCDDAYITFHYSRNLVRGDGLTWFGEHIEGYTNFSWALWIAAGIAAGIDPLVWAWAGSLACLVLALTATYRLVRLDATASAAMCAIAILATNFTFLAFGTSGLETMLQTALITVATLIVERVRRDPSASTTRRLVLLSTVAALALWTRLDSTVPLGVLAIALLVSLVRQRAALRAFVAAGAPALVLVGGWLAWKLAYYGDLLPNTFHAKVGITAASLAGATRFVGAFLHAYLLWPLLLLAAAVALVRRRVIAPLSVALVVAWFAYVIVVGGDFMEFRFFVPILPSLVRIIAETVTTDTEDRRIPSAALRAGVVVAALASTSWRHAATFEGVDDRYYDSIRNLGTYYGMVRDNDWAHLGSALSPVLRGSGATLACNGAGAIPYFADLPTIDQLGLNDRWVARHGSRPAPGYIRPGHQRFATYEYLVERKVTFVIGSPTTIEPGTLGSVPLQPNVMGWLGSLLGAQPLEVPQILVVTVPLDDRESLLMWYLTPSPEVTRRIREAGWELRSLVRH